MASIGRVEILTLILKDKLRGEKLLILIEIMVRQRDFMSIRKMKLCAGGKLRVEV